MLERFFRLSENQTTARIELLAGVTTFLTMAYIIVVQPAVLSGAMFGMKTGMDFGAVMTATCLSAALATALMALLARYPIAQAPGMGTNFFFIFSTIPAARAAGFVDDWQVALGVVFISGVLFLILSLVGLREMIFNAISPSMKCAIAAGIGLFIAFIGMQNTGLIVKDPVSAVKLNAHFNSPDLIVFFVGLLTSAVLHAKKIRGSILWGIVAADTLVCRAEIDSGEFCFTALRQVDASNPIHPRERNRCHAATHLADVLANGHRACAFARDAAVRICVFLRAHVRRHRHAHRHLRTGWIRARQQTAARKAGDGFGRRRHRCRRGARHEHSDELHRKRSRGGAGWAHRVDRNRRGGFISGLAVFQPAHAMVGSYPPITAPALVIVGAIMLQHLAKVDWKDYTETIPAFLTVIGIPLSYSIADGLALGFISYPLIKLFSGRGREANWLTYVLAVVLVFYFGFVRSKMG